MKKREISVVAGHNGGMCSGPTIGNAQRPHATQSHSNKPAHIRFRYIFRISRKVLNGNVLAHINICIRAEFVVWCEV